MNTNTVVMLDSHPNASPAIMEPSLYGFEELFEANQRRPINATSLGVSTQERAVLSMLNADRQRRGRFSNLLAAVIPRSFRR